MSLQRKREPEIIPSYSLTGDLLSFLRCGLQYRYHSGSALPPSRPVQMWYGEFIHGVLEAAYRIWSQSANPPNFPWPYTPTPYLGSAPAGRVPHDLGVIGERIEETLRAQGKTPRSQTARERAYDRALVALNEVAPHLFPLVESAEERVIGTRDLSLPGASAGISLRTNKYELHGVIDILSHVQLNSASQGNVIKEFIINACSKLPPQFEVVVDYKGTRRPPTNEPFWTQTEWQVQTYAWLRRRQPNSLPVAAGILIFINELRPTEADLRKLKQDIQHNNTDVVPASGSTDYYNVTAWQSGDAIPTFSLPFRLERAIRVIPVTSQSLANATHEFDQVVIDIEQCVATEAARGTIRNNWTPRGDSGTCNACDFRHFCPSPAPRQGTQPRTIPVPPAP